MLIGVAGEIVCDWKEMDGRLASAKRLSAILLVVGLMIEFWEAAKSDEEIAKLSLQSAQLNKDAADARQQTAELQKQIERTKKMRVSDLSFVTNLTKIPDVMVDVKYLNEQEPYLTATTLLGAFSMGGWRIWKFDIITNEPVIQVPYGISISYGIKIILGSKTTGLGKLLNFCSPLCEMRVNRAYWRQIMKQILLTQ